MGVGLLVREISQTSPQLRVLLTCKKDECQPKSYDQLRKPFTMPELVQKVRALLSDSATSTAMHDLAMLFSELKAIERWDVDYYRNSMHHAGDTLAYHLRQRRRKEILEEIKNHPSHARQVNAGDGQSPEGPP
jgi:hypothetical protein